MKARTSDLWEFKSSVYDLDLQSQKILFSIPSPAAESQKISKQSEKRSENNLPVDTR